MTHVKTLITVDTIPVGSVVTVDRAYRDGSVVVYTQSSRFVTLAAGEYATVEQHRAARFVNCAPCNDTGNDGDGCPVCGRY